MTLIYKDSGISLAETIKRIAERFQLLFRWFQNHIRRTAADVFLRLLDSNETSRRGMSELLPVFAHLKI